MAIESTAITSPSTSLTENHKQVALPQQDAKANQNASTPKAVKAEAKPFNAEPLTTKLATLADSNKEADSGPLTADELNDTLQDINNTLYSMNKAVRFEINDKTDDLVVRVINTDTDEVIRQYPSEEVLERKERLLEGDTSAFSTRVD